MELFLNIQFFQDLVMSFVSKKEKPKNKDLMPFMYSFLLADVRILSECLS